MGRKPKITKEQVKEIERLYRKGTPIKEICRMYGISHTTLYKYLWMYGIRKKPVPVEG